MLTEEGSRQVPRCGRRAVGVARRGRRRGVLLRCLLGLASLLAVLQPPSAAAFVRSVTKSCRPIFWPQSCLYVQASGELLGSDLSDAATTAAIQNAVQTWNDHLSISSFMQLRYLPPQGSQEVNPVDGLQLIKFRHDRWCRPMTVTTPVEVCFDQSATAVTTVTFINRPSDAVNDGKIVDADIDFNAVDFRFYDADQGQVPLDPRAPVDLWNTVTHELGHVMGLEHPCSLFPGAIPACSMDGQGNLVPDCGDVQMNRFSDAQLQTIWESTMYPTSSPGETSKRHPHADDVAGVITAYPKAHDPLTCRLPTVSQSRGCAAAPLTVPGTAAPLGAAAGLLALVLSRRGRRAR